MTPESIFFIFDLLLDLGIIVSLIAGSISINKDREDLYRSTNKFYFSGMAFVTVFLAFRTAEYLQKNNTFQFIFMLAGVCAGLIFLVTTYSKTIKRLKKAEQDAAANP